ncbi:glycoside hydrolase family 2 protein [Schizophyllum amplum]|uniref:Beta-mannosidase B n=1 Tax=Schizophyllum amplum TaxID=97359 RepID=A0A550C9V9_9AGAR|nr:glycoside hydrolase family 2 protein [Auriculariopsis ampla]
MSRESTNRALTDWSFTQIGGGEGTKDGEWLQCCEFPTTVHVELLRLGRIPDPFVGLHEWDVQWIGESRWAFKAIFSVSPDELSTSNVDLVFDGLDTFADVFLNGERILQAHNQFLFYRLPVKSLLQEGANELLLEFDSAFIRGRELEKKHGKHMFCGGDSSRLHVRKAQYNYGWDWGPTLITVGPWKSVFLHSYDIRIADLHVRSAVDENLNVAMTASFRVAGYASPFTANLALKDSSGAIIVSSDVPVESDTGEVQFSFEVGQIQLWYPVGYGAQPLYTVELELHGPNSDLLDTKEQRIAFRRVRVVQEELVDQPGLTFLFEVNNVRIFCAGSNWIPVDSFHTTITPNRYRAWLELLVNGNQNMLRVWGGGIYEADIFYDICDVLVWQDFMFACAQYQVHDAFLESVQEEAEQNVKRLRHHPSLVLFAGNNEDYLVAEVIFKSDFDYHSDERTDFRTTEFPARHIYERVLPSIVGKLSDVYYHPSSPYSGQGKPAMDQTLGDLHQWNVWHGSQEPWQNWDTLAGRFVSEFGMEGYPDIRTVDYWLGGDASERFPQSRVNANHNKADGYERRLELYLVENLKHVFDMESYVYYTQIMQAETLAAAYRLFRRNWQGPGRQYTAGALVWQLGDCWPTCSWAIVDYFLRPKPAYFAIARELRPFTVGMTRKEVTTHKDDTSAAFPTIDTVLEIWGTNSTLEEKKVKLEVTEFDLQSDWTETWQKDVTLAANASTELYKGPLKGQPTRTKKSEVPKDIIVSARLLDADGAVLSRYANWPEPFKFIKFPSVEAVGLDISVADDGTTVSLSVKKPIKGVILDVDGEDVKWSDQALDLVPGDVQIVTAQGLDGRKVKARFLGDGTA